MPEIQAPELSLGLDPVVIVDEWGAVIRSRLEGIAEASIPLARVPNNLHKPPWVQQGEVMRKLNAIKTV